VRPQDLPTSFRCRQRVVRSASIYLGTAAAYKRVAQRSHKVPTGSGALDLNQVGFRCAR